MASKRTTIPLPTIMNLVPRFYGKKLQWKCEDYLKLEKALISTEFYQGADNTTQDELLRTTQLIYSYQAGKMVPRLREPRQLYGLNSNEFGSQQFARWPSDVQVLPERVKHISTVPANPELFYQPTGMEKTPMAKSHLDEGRTVYYYVPQVVPQVGTFFMKSRVGGYRGGCLPTTVELASNEDRTLLFESRFESGNLGRAIQVGTYDYELWLRKDLYTTKHTQWYYFRVTNTRSNVNYRFTIVNLSKPSSLYNEGMKPLVYSVRNANDNKIGWVRCGKEIKYYRNNIKCGSSDKGDRFYYSLTWSCTLPHDGDTVYFAHCYPYMYSDLQDYLNDIATDPVKSKLCKTRVLCRTLAGNMVYILTITSPCKTLEENKSRKGIVITARVHPGETNASWMMKGFLDYLIGGSADAKLLRDMFVFKVVPMLNPDGVIIGNYRCSLTGRDLNRNYKTMLKDSFPSVWHTKDMVRKLLEEREVVMYVDLHGHSRRQNMFIYGCENRIVSSRRLHERVFPVMLGKNAPEKFRYESCKFHIQKSKEGTGRVVMWNMGILNSYTMEATFCGSSLGKRKGQHFTTADFESMGYLFCDTLLQYCDPERVKSNTILLDIEKQLKHEILQRLRLNEGSEVNDIDDINLDEYMFDVESSDGGSDSSASDGLPMQLRYMSKKATSKKKRLRSKKDRNNHRTVTVKESQKKIQLTPMSTAVTEKKLDTRPAKTAVSVKHLSLKNERLLLDNEPPQPTIKNDGSYLENITNIYLQNGIIVPAEQEKAIPHFRYTDANPLSAAAYATHVCTIQDPHGVGSGDGGGGGGCHPIMTSATSSLPRGGGEGCNPLSHLQQFKYPDALDDLPKVTRSSSSGLKRPPVSDLATPFHAITNHLQNCLAASPPPPPPGLPVQQMCMMPQESSPIVHHSPLPFETISNSLHDSKSHSAKRRCASGRLRKRPLSRVLQAQLQSTGAKPFMLTQKGRELCRLGSSGARNAIIMGNANGILQQKEPSVDTVVVESLSSGVIYPFMEYEDRLKDGENTQAEQTAHHTAGLTGPSGVATSCAINHDTGLKQTSQTLQQIRQCSLDSVMTRRDKYSPITGQFDVEVNDVSKTFQSQLVLDADEENGIISQQCQLPDVNRCETSLSVIDDALSSAPNANRQLAAGAVGRRPSTVGNMTTRLGTAELGGRSRVTLGLTSGLGQTWGDKGFTRQQIEDALCQGYHHKIATADGNVLPEVDVAPLGVDRVNCVVSTSYPCGVQATARTTEFEIKDGDRTSEVLIQSEDAQNGKRKVGCPTTISLMMSHTHRQSALPAGQFHSHPLTKCTGRPPLFRNLRR